MSNQLSVPGGPESSGLQSLMRRPLPREALGSFPSPLQSFPDLALRCGFQSLLVKRDDLNSASLGGNKVRALEWILPHCGSRVVTVGGYGSTHAAATALYARCTGRTTAVALFPQPWTPAVAAMLARTASCARVELAASRTGLVPALIRAWRSEAEGGRRTWIPAGGAGPYGVLGSVNGALECIAQCEAVGRSVPDVVVAPLGSGGTVAGLCLGFGFAQRPVTICAVPVSDPWLANSLRVRWLMHGTRGLLRRAGVSFPPRPARLVCMTGYLGRGYGHPTPAGERARSLAAAFGIMLDPCYGSKAFAAMLALSGSYREVCFWHTFDCRTPRESSEGDPEIMRRARACAEALWP